MEITANMDFDPMMYTQVAYNFFKCRKGYHRIWMCGHLLIADLFGLKTTAELLRTVFLTFLSLWKMGCKDLGEQQLFHWHNREANPHNILHQMLQNQ